MEELFYNARELSIDVATKILGHNTPLEELVTYADEVYLYLVQDLSKGE